MRLADLLALARAAPSLAGGPLLDHVLTVEDPRSRGRRLVDPDGVWCEFGVYRGASLQRIASFRGPRTKLWGFDSFRGLPEAYNASHPRGAFAVDHIPVPPAGACLLVGDYAETLPQWMPSDDIRFAYVDCDLRSSALHVFDVLLAGIEVVAVLDDFFESPENGVAGALAESVCDVEVLWRRGGGLPNESVAVRLP